MVTQDTNSDSETEMVANLTEIGKDLQQNISIQDRKYHFKTYPDCFLGSEAVDYLISAGHAESRSDAVDLGNILQSNLYLFEHATRDHPFKDEPLFYRFLNDSDRGAVPRNAQGEPLRWTHLLAPSSSSADSLQPLLPINECPELLDDNDRHVVAQVWPLDEYNRELLDNVHPPAWQDPANSAQMYDMVVIGAGAGGLVTSSGAAGVGAKVALIEAHLLGGDCLNVGCVPSKTLIHAANMVHQAKNQTKLAEAGVFLDPSAVKVDFEKVMERVRKVRAQISHHDSAERFSKELGVEVYIGWAKFASERTVEVNGKTLHFKRAVIATGGHPVLLPVDGMDELYKMATDMSTPRIKPRPAIMTNETVFNLTKQPKHMVVIGPGVVGMELAQAMSRLGTEITVLGRSGHVLPKENEDMAALVKTQMESDGVKFRLSVELYKKIELTGRVLENGYPEMKLTVVEKGIDKPAEINFDAVLIAAGRAANVTGMNLEAAKVEYDKQKGLIVNDKMQTTNSRIYGVGDVCSEFKFTHVADFMARAVIRNALFFGKEKMSDMLIPYATFTSPEIASVGLYEADLERQNIKYRIIEKHFKDNDRAICDDETAGFVRFRVDAKTDKILGASIVGENAGNMISEVTVVMQSDTGLGTLASIIHPYPTTAEVLRQAGDVYNKTKLTTTVKAVLRGVVKLHR